MAGVNCLLRLLLHKTVPVKDDWRVQNEATDCGVDFHYSYAYLIHWLRDPRQKRERREYNQYLIDQAEEAKQKADENAKKIQDVDRAIADYKNALGK